LQAKVAQKLFGNFKEILCTPKNLPAPTPMMLGVVDKIRPTYYNSVEMGARS